MNATGTRQRNPNLGCRGVLFQRYGPRILLGFLLSVADPVRHPTHLPLMPIRIAAAAVADAGQGRAGPPPGELVHPSNDALPIASRPDIPSPVPENEDGAEEASDETIGVEIEADPFGAYRVKGRINDRDVVLLVDTGASWISIPDRLKHNLNLHRGAYRQVATAGGVVGTYETRIESLEIGPLRFDNLAGLLNPRAPDEVILLGMNVLGGVRFEQRGGKLTITQRSGSGRALAQPARRERVPEFQRSLGDCLRPGHVIDRNTLDCLEAR